MNTALIGRWAICSHGRVGRIEGQKELPWGLSFIGTGLNGTPWASKNPTLIIETDSHLLEQLFTKEMLCDRCRGTTAPVMESDGGVSGYYKPTCTCKRCI